MGFWLDLDEGEGDKFIFEICDGGFGGSQFFEKLSRMRSTLLP